MPPDLGVASALPIMSLSTNHRLYQGEDMNRPSHLSWSDSRRLRYLIWMAAVSVLMAACATPGGSPAGTAPVGDPVAGVGLFEAQCASCHGAGAAGSDNGPPLVDDVYRRSHHADGAFQLAVLVGVRQHHWRFGSMPPQEGLSEQDVADIVAYVRQLQREAGIN